MLLVRKLPCSSMHLQRRNASVLVLNCGSSSLKSKLLDPAKEEEDFSCLVEGLNAEGAAKAKIKINGKEIRVLKLDHGKATMERAFDVVRENIPKGTISAIGHRVVHGGATFKKAVLIDEAVKVWVYGIRQQLKLVLHEQIPTYLFRDIKFIYFYFNFLFIVSGTFVILYF